jgi:phosphatidylglycerophosphate synthase
VFVVISLFSAQAFAYRASALAILLFIAFLDGLDGYIARKFDITSKIGGLLDTLGDRITENILIIFFIYKGLLPLLVGVVFVTRGFFADFIRSLNFKEGMGTFQISTSYVGKIFVSSNTSRVIYLVLKMMLFLAAGLFLVLDSPNVYVWREILPGLKDSVYYGSFVVLGFNILRFIVLLYDSRLVLGKYLADV